MPYSPLLVQPMREELTSLGVEELRTADAVDQLMNNADGTTLLVFNSVCGCAAGGARPAIRLALDGGGATPDKVVTVFAGQDVEATAKARSYIADIPPSSPSFALFKDGELVYFVPRHRIEGRSPEAIAQDLGGAFAEHCGVATS